MKMKKLLSVLLATMVITAAGCSGNNDSADSATTTAAEAGTVTTTAEKNTVSSDDNPLLSDEMKEHIRNVREGAPVYADFIETTSSFPLTMGFAVEQDVYGTGEPVKTEMLVGMISAEKFYITSVTDGMAMDIIITDGKYYMISAEEKTAIYMDMSDEEASSMSEEMTASIKANFDASAATYETGETEFEGKTYLYEKINTVEMGEVMIYIDKATNQVKYISSQGVTLEITTVSSEVDESKFEIPADYTLVDMAQMMG